MCNHQKVTVATATYTMRFFIPASICSFSIYQETKDPGSSSRGVCGLWGRDREAWRQGEMAVQRKRHRPWRQIRNRSWWEEAFPLHQSCHWRRCQHLRRDFRRVKGQVWAEGRIKARWETLMLQLCVWGHCQLTCTLRFLSHAQLTKTASQPRLHAFAAATVILHGDTCPKEVLKLLMKLISLKIEILEFTNYVSVSQDYV